jgi:phage shock protein C
MVAGVCGGIAEYFEIDPTLVRILFVVLVVISAGFALLAYVVAFFAMPKRSSASNGYIDVEPSPSAQPAQQATPPAQEPQPAAAGAAGTMGYAYASPASNASTPGAGYTASNPVASTAWSAEAVQEGAEQHKHNHVGAVTFGVILIATGLLVLVSNLIDVSFWRFWPLVIVLCGTVMLFTPGRDGWEIARAGRGIVLITVGLLLQIWMLRIITFGVFVLVFLNLWPVLLVLAGISIIAGARKSGALKLVGSLVLSLTLILGVWVYGGFGEPVSIQVPGGRVITFNVPASPLPLDTASGDFTWSKELDTWVHE